MKKEEHTPGPWSVNTDERYKSDGPSLIWGPKGPRHGIVCELPPSYPREFNKHDAYLIAAAPDLLQVCQLAAETIQIVTDIGVANSFALVAVHEKLLEAIHKAIGVQK